MASIEPTIEPAPELELEMAWEELSFWRDFAVWWTSERGALSESRVLEMVEMAERRYARALCLRHMPDYVCTANKDTLH